jgi:phosphoenolpyruvate carboxykinase (ATP)
MSGYTAKVAGTERGITEPQATFSACFGEPFLPLPPSTYARMLGELIKKHHSNVWLINTGWSGGGYGVGHRMKIAYTRALVTAALNGSLTKAGFDPDPVFGMGVPRTCEGVPADVLTPRKTWADKSAYDAKAKELARLFTNNFKRFEDVPANILAAGPKA